MNGVRVFDAEVEVDWDSGAFCVRGEISREADLMTLFWTGDACVVDGRPCQATGHLELDAGRVIVRGTTFPWRREEWLQVAQAAR